MKQLAECRESLASLTEFIQHPKDGCSVEVMQQFLMALNLSAIVSITDANGVITYVNEHFERTSGYSKNELIGKKHNIVRHPDMSGQVFSSLWKTITNKQPWRGLIKNRRKDGSAYYVKSVILPVTDSQGNVSQFLSIRNDVTDIVEAKNQLREQLTDELTGLPNRLALLNDLKKLQINTTAVLDLRNFKIFNDYWGIDIGDVYIKKLAQLIADCQREFSFKLYRLGGACFAIRPNYSMNKEQFCLMTEQLKHQLEHFDMVFNDIDCDIQLTVGVGVSETRALAYAESAIADSKEKFYGRSIVIKDDVNSRDDTFYWVEQIKGALKEGRITACFQQIKSTTSGVLKYEALARLKLKNGRIVSPTDFLEHLKKTRYYSELTKTILTLALNFARQRQCRVAVNLSIQDILDQDTVDFIMQQLQQQGGSSVIFEITESEAVNDFDKVSRFIKKVRDLGAAIAIDDFGSGYSNFVYLVQLKPEFIKIDGSIISSIVDNEQSYLVTQSIVEMARNLKVKTIAEFVSSEQILTRLQPLNIDFLQGFHIHSPELIH
ncbi:MAG: EAL domain-containing protein [Pseudomonadota bacterium]